MVPLILQPTCCCAPKNGSIGPSMEMNLLLEGWDEIIGDEFLLPLDTVVLARIMIAWACW